MRLSVFSLALTVLPAVLSGQMPDFYKTVYRVSFVVKDAEAVSAQWERLGAVVVDGPNDGPGGVTVTTSALGNVLIDWIQPNGGDSVFGEFHKRHGDAVFGLMHRVPNAAAIDAEVARMKSLGVGTVMDSTYQSEMGPIRAVYFDTLEEGKYALGLIAEPDSAEDQEGGKLSISQFAFVARSLDPVSRYWAKLGLPELAFTSGKLSDLVYKDQPGKWTSRLGWQRHGKVVYEWIEPKDGPSTYLDHLTQSGEGLHHFGVDVPDMDKAIEEYRARGLTPVMSGGWGEKGKPGSGRFQYMRAPGAVEIELLWSYRGK
jgi:catechol 2,3-dioxygenase-like lactoylglutathione lyase family enzyme